MGRLRDCVPFDQHSQYRRPFRGVPSDQGVPRTPWFVKSFLGLDPIQRLLKSQVDRLPEGPSGQIGEPGKLYWLARRATTGQTVRSQVKTPEGYSLTAATAIDAACRVIAGEIKPGFQTSSRAFGADYFLKFDGVVREELNC